jgi:hypothetical protein
MILAGVVVDGHRGVDQLAVCARATPAIIETGRQPGDLDRRVR